MPTGIPAADIVQAGVGLGEGVVGLINAAKTKQIAGQLAANRPQYQISPLTGQDLSLAKSDLANGMSDSASRAYNDLNNAQFSSSIGATLRDGGDVNDIGSIYGSNQDGALKLAQMKDQLRLQNVNNYLKTSQNMQDAEQTQWQVNKFAPWQDKVQANAAARQAAQQEISNGLNAFGSGIGNAGNAVSEKNAYSIPTYSNNADYNSRGYATGVPSNNPTTYLTGATNLTNSNMPTYTP